MRSCWMLALLGVIAVPAAGREPPAAHCIDGRAITEVHQVDARTLLLRDADGAGGG